MLSFLERVWRQIIRENKIGGPWLSVVDRVQPLCTMPFYYMVGSEALLHNQDIIKDTEFPSRVLERVRECE